MTSQDEGGEQGSPPSPPNDASARWVYFWSAVTGGAATLAVLPVSRPASLALAWGAFCGIANLWAVRAASRRLLNTGAQTVFRAVGFARLYGFSLLSLALLLVAPPWSILCYFVTFLVPTLLNTIAMFVDPVRREPG